MSSPIVRLLRDYCCQDLLESSPIFFFLSIRSRFPRRPCLSNEDSNEDESIRFPRFLIFEREKWRPLVKNHPRKRICVSIYIRRRPLLRGDGFNRCIPFARLSQVDPGNRDNASSPLSTVSPWNFLEFCRTIISFDRRRAFSFLLFFSFLFFFFLFIFYAHRHTACAVSFYIRLANNPAFKVSVTAVFNRSSIPTATYSSLLSPRKPRHAVNECTHACRVRSSSVANRLRPIFSHPRSVSDPSNE